VGGRSEFEAVILVEGVGRPIVGLLVQHALSPEITDIFSDLDHYGPITSPTDQTKFSSDCLGNLYTTYQCILFSLP
jgi:hypothetical protein